jgi:hypothetical protein
MVEAGAGSADEEGEIVDVESPLQVFKRGRTGVVCRVV